MLADYERVLPGSAERIMAMAERQSEHRIRLESSMLKWDNWRSMAGLIAGSVIALATLYIGLEYVREGESAYGFAAILGTLASLVAVYVAGKLQQDKELARKRKQLEESREPEDSSSSQ
jgi:hypothetical protein